MRTSTDPRLRVVGVDVARCLALLGMMAIHVLPAQDDGGEELSLAYEVASGRASALFAVLAGVSLALTTGRTVPERGRRLVGSAAGIAVRAVLVAAIGLGLGELDSGIAVILAYYGVLFLLAVPFLGLRAPWLFAIAVPWLLVAPLVSHAVRRDLPPPTFEVPSYASLDDLPQLLGDLALTGYYPAVPWLGYVLLGLAVGRTDLRSRLAPLLLGTLGAAAALLALAGSGVLVRQPAAQELLVASFGTDRWSALLLATGFHGTTPTDSWWWLTVASPHSGTPFDLAHTAGTSCAVLGLCLLVGRVLPRASRVVFGAGAMSLTLYTAHVLLRVEVWDADTGATYLRFVVAALAVGAAFALLRWRGPLELVVGWPSGWVRRVVAGQPRRPSGVGPRQ